MMTNSNSNLSRTSERTKSMVRVAVMAGIAFVLMFIDFPLLFVAPSFMKLDLSDVPGLIAGFAMGPAYGVMVQFIKVLLNLSESITGGVGELSNFIVGSSLVLVSSFIYHKNKTIKSAGIGLFFGVIVMTAIAMASNYFIVFPLYAKIMIPMETLVAMGSAITPKINSLETMMIYSVLPFNLLKGTISSIATLVLYKRVRRFF